MWWCDMLKDTKELLKAYRQFHLPNSKTLKSATTGTEVARVLEPLRLSNLEALGIVRREVYISKDQSLRDIYVVIKRLEIAQHYIDPTQTLDELFNHD